MMEAEALLSTPHSDLTFTRADIETSVSSRLQRVAQHFGQRPALLDGSGCWSYNELWELLREKSGGLAGTTAPVAVLAPVSPVMVMAALAVVLSGRKLLSLHPRLPLQVQQQQLAELGGALVVAAPGLEEQARSLAGASCPWIAFEQLSGSARLPELGPDHEALVYFTSGSTARPRPVVRTHRSLLHRVWLGGVLDGLGPNDRQSLLTHSGFAASEADIFATLLHGGCCCPFDPAAHSLGDFGRWLHRAEITLLHPPVLYFRKFLATLPAAERFSNVRLLALAGELVRREDLLNWSRHASPASQVRHRFSSTETAILTLSSFALGEFEPQGWQLGQPVPDKELEIWDEQGKAVAVGEAGRLVVRSPYLSAGQKDDAEPAKRIFVTGDRGRLLPDGRFEFLGRLDDVVKVRGYRLSLREVEEALLSLPEVDEAAVTLEGEQLVAWLAPPVPAGAPALRRQLETCLPEWKLPQQYHFFEELPRTLTGKIDRPNLAVPSEPQPAGALGSPLVEQLSRLWCQELGRAPVAPQQNLLQAGGDSITVVLLLNLIERELAVSLTPADFFQDPTLEGLARHLGGGGAVQQSLPQPSRTATDDQPESVAEALLLLLLEHGVDTIFYNPGTDNVPMVEALARRQALGLPAPRVVLCLHEAVALAAAHGYFQTTGRVAMVYVHVGLGLQNLGGALHNAQRGRVGVILAAGRSPFAEDDRVAGGRDRPAHWLQDQRNQESIVNDFVLWHYRLPHQENLRPAVERALDLVRGYPPGPVYLELPREILLESCRPAPPARRSTRRSGPSADRRSLDLAAAWLLEAQRPLLLVSQLGRIPEAVEELVQLAESLALPVVESRHYHNFPLSHPLHQGHRPLEWLPEADLVLVVDHEVPWIPLQWQPSPDCRVVQLDQDTSKSSIPMWSFPIDLSLQGDSAELLRELRQRLPAGVAHESGRQSRRHLWAQRHRQRRQSEQEQARTGGTQSPMTPEWVASCLQQQMDERALVICEAVTSSPAFWGGLELGPGRFFQNLGSTLGWGLGAALGARLARPDHEVFCIVGDGSWMFGQALAVYEAMHQQQAPFFTLVLNNGKYAAIHEAIQGLRPGGWSASTASFPGCALPALGYYARVAEAVGLWSCCVLEGDQLPARLAEGLVQLRQGRGVLVEVWVSSPHL